MIRRTKIKILVVDDSSVVRQLLTLWLHKIGPCDVETAGDGLAALQKVNAARETSAPFQLVITDLSMPNMNGIQFCELVRKSDSKESLPVVMLTTFAGSEYREKARIAGANDYLTKPLRYFELVRVLYRLFPAENGGASPEPHRSLRTALAG